MLHSILYSSCSSEGKMWVSKFSLTLLGLLATSFMLTEGQELPSVYEYFVGNSTTVTGLVAGNKQFTLNGKYIKIISGAIHYFRVHPDLWRDRLRKLRATGANTVETYVPWNLHEPESGNFDFGNGNNDFSAFLNIRRYIQIAQEEDLLVLFRPGPYICSEWDYGGLPSWLQRDPEMKVREYYVPYLYRVKIFLDELLPQIVDLQFTRGGPIIAAQIENEYNSFSPRSTEYLDYIRQLFLENGLDCLFYTSDNSFGGDGMGGTLPGVLQTANFQTNPDGILERLQEIQPDMPVMAMEFWSGWFNHWFDGSQATSNPTEFRSVLDTIIGKYNGSVNFYMFHGGTNFAFMAGGNSLGEPPYIASDITSYDYDAPLSEAGDYTEKYDYIVELVSQYENPKLRKPERPSQSLKTAYPSIPNQRYLSYDNMISQIPSSHKVQIAGTAISMENLPINNDNGQSYGYVIYRKVTTINNGDRYKGSWPRDFAQLIVDGVQVDTGYSRPEPVYWMNSVQEFPLNVNNGTHTVDLLVENTARINFGGRGDFVQQKGIAPIHQSKIEINDIEVQGLEIIAAEFKSTWVKSLENWMVVSNATTLQGPVLIQSTLTIAGQPSDTFLDMSSWHKGIVFVNGFNIGRYFRAGPQQTLYIPAPLLNTGENTITVFEQLEPASQLVFRNVPNLG